MKEKTNKRKIINSEIGKTVRLGFGIAIFIATLCGGIYIIFRTYTISIDLADGSGVVLTEHYSVGAGELTLGIPVRSGYRFTGWTGSNGSTPQTDVIVGNGNIGDLSYTANWSDELNVTCQDWVVDADNNMITEITSDVDAFLKEGKSSKGYQVKDRTIRVKSGQTISADSWGNDESYKAYSAEYVYVGSSKDTVAAEDGMIVYRYFYPILDVNYLVDGKKPSDLGLENSDIAFFDLLVDGETVLNDAYDFCSGVPYGSEYEVKIKKTNFKYSYEKSKTDSGVMSDVRISVDISFYSD